MMLATCRQLPSLRRDRDRGRGGIRSISRGKFTRKGIRSTGVQVGMESRCRIWRGFPSSPQLICKKATTGHENTKNALQGEYGRTGGI